MFAFCRRGLMRAPCVTGILRYRANSNGLVVRWIESLEIRTRPSGGGASTTAGSVIREEAGIGHCNLIGRR